MSRDIKLPRVDLISLHLPHTLLQDVTHCCSPTLHMTKDPKAMPRSGL